jgi:hypothetical protein
VEIFISNTMFKSGGVGLGYLLECLKTDDKTAFKDIVNKIPSATLNAVKYEGYILIDDVEDQMERLVCDMYETGITHEKAASLFCLLNKEFLNIGDNILYKKMSMVDCLWLIRPSKRN